MRTKQLGLVAVLSFSSLFAGAAGCVLDSDGGPTMQPDTSVPATVMPGSQPSSTREHLARPRTFSVQAGGDANVTATRLWGEDVVTSATLPVLGGELVVQALSDGRLAVRSMKLSFGDFHLSETSVPPLGLDLMGITLSIDDLIADATWKDDAAAVSADGELLLDWSLRAENGVLPMATQRIDDVPITLDVVPGAGGRLTAVLHATRPGTFFVWTGLMELSDLQLAVQAVE